MIGQTSDKTGSAEPQKHFEELVQRLRVQATPSRDLDVEIAKVMNLVPDDAYADGQDPETGETAWRTPREDAYQRAVDNAVGTHDTLGNANRDAYRKHYAVDDESPPSLGFIPHFTGSLDAQLPGERIEAVSYERPSEIWWARDARYHRLGERARMESIARRLATIVAQHGA